MKDEQIESVPVPLRFVGPIVIHGEESTYTVRVPLATFESPLWPSVTRGARVTGKAGGISTVILNDAMARSVVFDAGTAKRAAQIVHELELNEQALYTVAEQTSRHLHCTSMVYRIVGSCVYVRLSGSTADASGHNIITKAADAVLHWICASYPDVHHISASGNYCTDKKVSAVNAILGRGKAVVAEVIVPRALCTAFLKATPESIVELNTKKNLVGSIINGGVHSANAHFANMLLGLYLATGQDAANIVEGSQGISYAELRGDDLYFSVTLPNIIVGTVGNGKHFPFAQKALQSLGCLEERPPGHNSRRLAEIVAATVLCGELNLLAALTNKGELVRSHMAIERGIAHR
jgi:hydroxymethylglutaryl-CoA reductase (NADPH)